MSDTLPPGLYKTGTIDSVNPSSNTATVTIDSSRSVTGAKLQHDVDILYPFIGNNGTFIGTLPPVGTPVILLQGASNAHQISSYLPSNRFSAPTLLPGEVLFQSESTNKILLNQKDDMFIGSGNKDAPGSVHIKPSYNLLNINFNHHVSFTKASRSVTGEVRRDLSPNQIYSGNSKLYSDDYDKNSLVPIGLDPTLSQVTNSIQNQNKNPPFVESRNVIYEFSYDSNIRDLFAESNLYKSSTSNSNKSTVLNDRRMSRADTLSLSLTSPNYLIESISGTVIDIYGKLLDINRYPLQIGADSPDKLTLKSKDNLGGIDKDKTYLAIRDEQRKSIAYHFELNARKDRKAVISAPGINDIHIAGANYGRDRSRLFIDIDKEGQFKINIPASSETGNIPLLTRYENYSTLNPDDPNNLEKIDIVQDSFAAGISERNPSYAKSKNDVKNYNRGVISIKRNGIDTTPIDRFFSGTSTHLKHGTAHHDITNTLVAHQISQFQDYLYATVPANNIIPLIDFDIVNKTIEVYGDSAKAGGRSGNLNLDGSVELNIGANTIDRQSIWLDTAGGMVANFGKDLNGISAAINMDGNLLIEVGGYGVTGDSRFIKNNNAFTPGVVDIRVLTFSNRATIFRIDQTGVQVISPKQIVLQCNGDLKLKSNANMYIEAEEVTIQRRIVNKDGTVAPYI